MAGILYYDRKVLSHAHVCDGAGCNCDARSLSMEGVFVPGRIPRLACDPIVCPTCPHAWSSALHWPSSPI